jgi:hypothetical protein
MENEKRMETNSASTIEHEKRMEAARAKQIRAEASRLEKLQKFAPKARRGELEKKAKNAEISLSAAKYYAKTKPGECAVCGGPRVAQCMCSLSESSCERGHQWYWCAEHRVRVNHERADGPCTEHV